MSTGVLVLASNTAPVKDIVFHNETGVLVEPYDIDAFTEQMLNMLDQPKKYTKNRKYACQLMVSNYGFDTCLSKLAELYMVANRPVCNSTITPVKG